MEREVEYEEGTKQTSGDTESVEMNGEEAPRLDLDDGRIEDEEDEELQEKRKQDYEEYMAVYRELVEERERATQHNVQLQAKLSEYFGKKACGDERPAEEVSYEELLREFGTSSKIQADLKQQLRCKAAQLQGKLQELDSERLALTRLQSAGAAQATAQSSRPDVQLQQAVGLCRRNGKLRTRIGRLVEQASTEENRDVDPLLLQFHRLQLDALERDRNAERLEKPSRLQRMLVSSLERLTNVKAKLDFCQTEVRAKRGRLTELEATLDEKRHVLAGIRQTRDELQGDNLRLKEQQGLLGNKVLLGDLEDIMDASDRLEERLLQQKSIDNAPDK